MSFFTEPLNGAVNIRHHFTRINPPTVKLEWEIDSQESTLSYHNEVRANCSRKFSVRHEDDQSCEAKLRLDFDASCTVKVVTRYEDRDGGSRYVEKEVRFRTPTEEEGLLLLVHLQQ